MAFADVDLASTYFMQRLAQARQAEKMTASMQFDLARSPMSDDELEDIVDEFRDTPQPRQGWGMADMFEEVLSRSPRSVSVTDMKALQTNLIARGYAPPEASADGVWNPSWYAAFRRFDRDNMESQRAGRHWYSAPVESGIRAITNTLPSRVFQGLVGTAKGVVLQTPETFERGGALGGAVAGGAIGAAAGSVIPGLGTAVGAGVGAAIGGGAGFLMDLFGDDEGEEDQSGAERLIDALQPFNEYAEQGPKAFWEDLGYVLTATSFISGAGLAAKGVAGGVRGLQAARLTEEAGAVVKPLIGQSPVDLAPMTVGQQVVRPGSWAKAALMPTKAAGQTELGAFGTILRAARRRMTTLPGTPAALEQTLAKWSPTAFAQRVGPNIALKGFAGSSQAAMGGRLFGGIGQGSGQDFLEAKSALEAKLGRDLTEDELAEISKNTAGSTIEKSIANAPMLKSGIEVPLVGDLVDVAAFVIYPERLLPFSGARVAKSATNLLGDTSLLPYIHAVQDGTNLSLAEAKARVKDLISPTDNAWLRADYGINREAAEIVQRAYRGNYAAATRRRALQHARADIIRQIRKETEQTKWADNLRSSAKRPETLERVMSYSVLDPTDFEGWLIGLNGHQRGLDKLTNWKQATSLSRRLEREVQENMRLTRNEVGEVTGAEAWLPGDPTSVPYMGGTFTRPTKERVPVGGVSHDPGTRQTDIISIEERIKQLDRRATAYERTAKRGTTDPWVTIQLREQARLARSEIGSLQDTLGSLKSLGTKTVERDRFRIVPARADYADKQTWAAARKQFNDLRQQVLKAPTDQAKVIARQQLSNFVDDLAAKGMIPDQLAAKAKVDRPGTQVADYLKDQGKGAASAVKLPGRYQQEFDALGYKAVESGDDVIFPDQLDQLMEVGGIGDYTRRAAVFESLGLSPRWRSDRSVFRLRRQHELSELSQVFEEEGVRLSGEQGMKRLHDKLREFNHDGAVLGPFVKGKSGKVALYKVDTRDLSPELIFQAFEDVPGFTDDTARKVFAALRRGAAFGGEVQLRHPIDSLRLIGQATRTNGLPGFSDAMRTWHANVPPRINRREWAQGEVRYKPPASSNPAFDLAHSPARAKTDVELKKFAAKAGVTEGQRAIGMKLLDALAIGQVKAGRFKSVEEFFAKNDVGYMERYIAGDYDLALYKVRVTPEMDRTTEELKFLAQTFEGSRFWYDDSTATLQDIFKMAAPVELRNGKKVAAFDLMAQLIAATSPLKDPHDNWVLGLRNLETFLNDVDAGAVGVMGSVRGMLDDILNGRTIDEWDEPFRVTKKGTPASNRSRQKVYNFYHNLIGDLDKVTVDTWMARLFGLDSVGSADEFDWIAARVTEVAEDLTRETGTKWYPAQVQASLWAAVKQEAADEYIRLAVAEEKAGKSGAAYRRIAEDVLDARSYADLTTEPKIAPLLEDVLGKLNGGALLQMVQDEVLGLTQFGPDFTSIMRFFRSGDFSTLIHENAHLLRRLLSDADVDILEDAYGLRQVSTKIAKGEPAAVVPTNTKKFRGATDEMLRRAHSADDGNGFTWDPHTGEFLQGGVPGAGTAVAANPGGVQTLRLITPDEKAFTDPVAFRAEIRKLLKEQDLENSRLHIGGWKDEDGIHIDISEILPDVDTARQVGVLRKQKTVFNLETFEELPSTVWTRAAEERFAEDAEQYLLGKLTPGKHQGVWDALKGAVAGLWSSTRPAAVETNLVPRATRKLLDDTFADVLDMVPVSRTRALAQDMRSKQAVGGAAAGAGLGALEGDDPRDALKGAIMGAGGGLALRGGLKHTYGYLPDALTRMNTALRYTLSFTFDLGRYTEQNSIAMAKFNLPPMLSPKRYINARGWRSPYRAGEVRGEEAWKDAIRFWDELNGTSYFQNVDDLDRRMYQAGLLGFSPRNWEVAQAFQLYQRGWDSARIEEAISQIGRYGMGRTAAEKSANFVVFPFSFAKKYLNTLGDFMLQAPARNLILHELSRRYYESEFDEGVDTFLSKHAPLLKELSIVNNLAFGISPGRFFLQGMSDNRTSIGKAMMALGSFFVPSGAATPLAQAAGGLGDFAVHAFTPIVLTGESFSRAGGIDGMDDIFRRYIPFVRELDQYFTGENAAVPRQLTAMMEGADPYFQFQSYQDGLRMAKSELEPYALTMGYSSVDGLMQSDMGMLLGPQIEAQRMELAKQYPTGFRMSQSFESQDQIDKVAIMDLANKADRSAAEDHVLELLESVAQWDEIGSLAGLDADTLSAISAQDVRSKAMRWAEDRRFVELWDRFFLREYGPIRRVA